LKLSGVRGMAEQQFEIPFKKGTKKYLVAEKVLSAIREKGQYNPSEIAEEVGVSKATVYNVVSILRKGGYIPKKMGEIKSNLPTHQDVSQQLPQGSTSGGSPSGSAQQLTGEQTSLEIPSKLVDDIAEKVAEILKDKFAGEHEPNAKPSMLPEGVEMLGETMDVKAEKVNYKVALNPEIFHRYNVFKAEVARRGKKWEGTFSDWLDLVTRDILKVYGIYPAVITMKGKKLIVELPVETVEEAS